MVRKKSTFIVATTAVLTLIGWGIFTFKSSEQNSTESSEKTAHTVLTVSTMSPKMMMWNRSLMATGNIAPWQEAFVSTEANGVSILLIHTDIGETVRKGQLLAELQHNTLSAELEQVEAELAQAISQHEEAQADAVRAQKLRQTSALSAQQITQYLIAEKVARTRTEALQARVKSAQIRLAQTRIIAPDDGVITERQASLGKVVSTGEVLFRLLRQSRLEWRAELPAKDLLHVQPGQHATLNLPGSSAITGTVRKIAPTIDPHTGNGLVYIDLNTQEIARAGSFTTGHIQLGEYQSPGLPLTALTFRDGFAYVFYVDDEGKVYQRQVTPGQRRDGWISVTSGVDLQDRFIASGVGFLSEGDTVRVIHQIHDPAEEDPVESITLGVIRR